MLRIFAVLLLLTGCADANAGITVQTVDFLDVPGVTINAAGPLLVQMDDERNRLVVANTLSSSISIIDCGTHTVTNIPLDGRVLQHLKSECMTLNRKNGNIYLIGTRCFHIITPRNGKSKTIPTRVQFESIAVDEETGNVFIAGRESPSLGFYRASSGKLKMKKWLDHSEPLINLNQTPPPPIRKVIADMALGRIIAVDGFTSTIYTFDPKNGKRRGSRNLELTAGGRWHMAGYNARDHRLFIVTETDKRKVIEAAMIDVTGDNDTVVPLPGLSEGVGIIYNPARGETYIPYDNHPTVHVVDFHDGGSLDEIRVPAFGNDASAIDLQNDILFVASWAFGEIDVIDLKTRTLRKRITGLGIIPHMFTMAYNSHNNTIYFPKGATAVNGTFGAAVTALDPVAEETKKIYTGWAPVGLIEMKDRNSFLVFNSEDQFAEVRADGNYELYRLPYDYPVQAIHGPAGNVYLSYGPHQSYWPTVYIWGAKNGIITIDAKTLGFYDRRIPRQAHEMALDRNGILYFTQNNWGREEQFVGTLEDEVRVFDAGNLLRLEDEVEREITQRILRYDPGMHRLYLVRTGEQNTDPSMLQVIDLEQRKVIVRIELGRTVTDLTFDTENIYAAGFDSDNVLIIGKRDFEVREVRTGEKPLRLCRCGDRIYVINHGSNSLQEIGKEGGTFGIPYKGRPDNLFNWDNCMIITSHDGDKLRIIEFDPETRSFTLVHGEKYPYGDISFESGNVSFYLRGQFGDALFTVTNGTGGADGRFRITDFLSGKLFILERN